MAVDGINAASGTNSIEREFALPTKALGQDEFLKLVVAQFTSQDPLKPTADTTFIAQMAQFTSLEQTRAMQKDMSAMRTEQQLLQANALIGRAVEAQIDSEDPVSGTVSAVQVEAGTPKLVVNGTAYTLNQIRAVSAP
jgi:flagellar basal-body rod modification protein FlgD